MALWKALALLAMMVPAVMPRRQDKPALTTKAALSHIYVQRWLQGLWTMYIYVGPRNQKRSDCETIVSWKRTRTWCSKNQNGNVTSGDPTKVTIMVTITECLIKPSRLFDRTWLSLKWRRLKGLRRAVLSLREGDYLRRVWQASKLQRSSFVNKPTGTDCNCYEQAQWLWDRLSFIKTDNI